MSDRLYSPARERLVLPGHALAERIALLGHSLSGLLSSGVKVSIARPIKRT